MEIPTCRYCGKESPVEDPAFRGDSCQNPRNFTNKLVMISHRVEKLNRVKKEILENAHTTKQTQFYFIEGLCMTIQNKIVSYVDSTSSTSGSKSPVRRPKGGGFQAKREKF